MTTIFCTSQRLLENAFCVRTHISPKLEDTRAAKRQRTAPPTPSMLLVFASRLGNSPEILGTPLKSWELP